MNSNEKLCIMKIFKSKCLFQAVLLLMAFGIKGQSVKEQSSKQVERPKLVVGIVIDQMRWDYLYRYYNRYSATGGFRRILDDGFSCENTMIPYTPTVTACGQC